MGPGFSLVIVALVALLGSRSDTRPDPRVEARRATLPDSALDELAAGRYWHATRLLREHGAARGSPLDVLTLARAEAGWDNWPAVASLLEGADWIEHLQGGAGVYLLARALEEAERWPEAVTSYRRASSLSAPGEARSIAARARWARASWHAGEHDAALAVLDQLGAAPVARSWTAVELGLLAAADGDVAGVRRLLAHAIEPGAMAALWRAEADALLNARDPVGAAAAFAALVASESGERRAVAQVELGRLRLAAGDTAAARDLLWPGLAATSGEVHVRAAEALHDIGDADHARALQLARILDRAGDGARALAGYDRASRLVAADGGALPEASRVERARLIATVRERQEEALDEFREIRETTVSERVGARNLEVWAQVRARQGLNDQVATLRGWLLEAYPSSSEAAEVVWSEGSNAELAGRLDHAMERYRFLADNAGAHARAGEARMRVGQIHLRRDDPRAAAVVFEAYLADFPTGRRWQEAAYWAGRSRMELGEADAARAHLLTVLEQPIEYYAVMAADLLDVPYAVDLPRGPEPIEPGWLTEGLARLDVLTEAGLDRGATAEVERLRTRAVGTVPVALRLAEALIERGRTVDGIGLGWSLLAANGNLWDQQVLRITYPFPYRELVRREAAEWGLDPFMLAAIIRQESAFKADIVSRAGAVGLMQVMPPTGAQLARAHGPSGFTEDALTRPEVNLHLGAAFFRDMSRRYGDDLPLVLSAYNAGPTRATRWRSYPEISDPLRFTERIPIVETRGYVKSVRRNLGLYRVLYGQD